MSNGSHEADIRNIYKQLAEIKEKKASEEAFLIITGNLERDVRELKADKKWLVRTVAGSALAVIGQAVVVVIMLILGLY